MSDDPTPPGISRNRLLAGRLATGALSVRTPSGMGSAVMVKDRILTAAHVVLPGPSDTWDARRTIYDVGIGRDRFPCTLYAYEETNDIALLEPIDLEKTRTIPRFTVSSNAYIGDPIWVGGYPFDIEIPVVRRGSIASIVMPNEAMIIDRPTFASVNALFPAFWIDVPVFPGNSGGPVLNEEGELIGLALRTYEHSHEIKEFMPGPDGTGNLPKFQPVPVYLDIGIALRLTQGLSRTGLDRHLERQPLK